jgi:hypothetical protein
VREVLLSVGREGIDMRVISDALPEVDLWGAKRRASFFEKAFGIRLSIFWQPGGQDALVGPAMECDTAKSNTVEFDTVKSHEVDAESTLPTSPGQPASDNGRQAPRKKRRGKARADAPPSAASKGIEADRAK